MLLINSPQHGQLPAFLKRFILAFSALVLVTNTKAQSTISSENTVYQIAVSVGSKQAYLWIPPTCKHISGLIISFANLLERNWLEDPIIRKTAAKNNLAIILIELSTDGVTPDLKATEKQAFLKLLKDFGSVSGYPEIEYAPMIPIDHSVHGVFTWNLPDWLPERVIAAIPVKTFPLPPTLGFKNIPVCYITGENDEWPPVKDGRLWSRNFIWPVIRSSAVALRTKDDNNLIGVVTDAGGGHLDWSDRLSKFMALYIDKACHYRLPKSTFVNGEIKLKFIDKRSGWLTDTGGLTPDKFAAAPYRQYKGDADKTYWFFDKETAMAATAIAGDRVLRKIQMLTFIQNGNEVAIAKQGFVPLQFIPEQDGITFKLKGGFLSQMPPELIGAGKPLSHADGDIKFRIINGPAIQTGPDQFRLAFNRSSPGGDVWIQEEQAGDAIYKHAVQPGVIKIPAKLTDGKAQQITFDSNPDQPRGIKQIGLSALSDAGLPVRFYVNYGPAIVKNNRLYFTGIPPKSRYPIKVSVTAYQWGSINTPRQQSAETITHFFFIKKR